jgi:hypothetical protein
VELREAGLTNTDLRLMLCQGFVEHRVEHLDARSPRRSFRRLNSLALPDHTCFVLTPSGAEFLAKCTVRADPGHGGGVGPRGSKESVPRWDVNRRQLWRCGVLIKQYRVPALNQETVLCAFEEEGWPARIDDPLPQVKDQDPRSRLRETIRSLNRNQSNPLIQFQGDGNGTGILWDAVAPAAPVLSVDLPPITP